ncbi:MAG TPA: hypothetical protein VLX92_06775 [Kofleriaceae bacterium]|nr:hypothetical protein [Kofleriaceae bacterium]
MPTIYHAIDPIGAPARTLVMPPRLRVAVALAIVFAIGCGTSTYVYLDAVSRAARSGS